MKGFPDVTAAAYGIRSDEARKRKREDDEAESKDEVETFLSKLATRTPGVERFCEIQFADKWKTLINAELAARGFSYRWGECDSETYCSVSWGIEFGKFHIYSISTDKRIPE